MLLLGLGSRSQRHPTKLACLYLENLITLCQAPIKRDLLAYNAKIVRYELLKAIRHQAAHRSPSDHELQANPDQD